MMTQCLFMPHDDATSLYVSWQRNVSLRLMTMQRLFTSHDDAMSLYISWRRNVFLHLMTSWRFFMSHDDVTSLYISWRREVSSRLCLSLPVLAPSILLSQYWKRIIWYSIKIFGCTNNILVLYYNVVTLSKNNFCICFLWIACSRSLSLFLIDR